MLDILPGVLTALLLAHVRDTRILLWIHAAVVPIGFGYCFLGLPPGVPPIHDLGWPILVPLALASCALAALGALAMLGSEALRRCAAVALLAWGVLMTYSAQALAAEWAIHVAVGSTLKHYCVGATLIAQAFALPVVMGRAFKAPLRS